ncbi:hypothetical protein PR202_ga25619 [Eleusine coracana subsp. coracana]|uniref:Uncharacterized protein n=1 Tax=Eleusine coracana subsp. coracana TaxID=191504 RepID=A0AAV5DBI1_ELECO|nr:hypothetical protein PR202_ga25619 [Eleusine coracana subsp. coracana]
MADRDNAATFIDLILAIILPPLGISCPDRSIPILRGLVQIEFWICLLLSCFGYLPGIVYAVWAIIKE